MLARAPGPPRGSLRLRALSHTRASQWAAAPRARSRPRQWEAAALRSRSRLGQWEAAPAPRGPAPPRAAVTQASAPRTCGPALFTPAACGISGKVSPQLLCRGTSRSGELIPLLGGSPGSGRGTNLEPGEGGSFLPPSASHLGTPVATFWAQGPSHSPYSNVTQWTWNSTCPDVQRSHLGRAG